MALDRPDAPTVYVPGPKPNTVSFALVLLLLHKSLQDFNSCQSMLSTIHMPSLVSIYCVCVCFGFSRYTNHPNCFVLFSCVGSTLLLFVPMT